MKKRFLPVIIATGFSLLLSPLSAYADTNTTISESSQTTSAALTQSSVPNATLTDQKVHSGSAEVDMTMGTDSFSPKVIYVTPGTTVTWVNDDIEPHDVTSDTGLFSSKGANTFSYTFDNPGTYNYHCAYHSALGMVGTVIVQNQSSSTSTTTSTSSTSSDSTSSSNSSTSINSNISSKDNSKPYSIAPLGTGTDGEIKQADDTYLLPYKMENGYKVFHLDAKPVWWEVKPGKKVEAWAYNGTVPGPEIKVNQGDKVKIVVKNDLPEGTTVHWHGLDVPFAQDGVGGLSQPDIAPGQSWTYTFTINKTPGTYMYHTHPSKNLLKQENMGLFGPIIVEPKGTGWQQIHPGYQDEYTVFVNASPQFGYTINGLSFPATPTMPVTLGDKVLIHLLNIGSMYHPMHLHGQHFQEIAQDGVPLPSPITMDTISTAPGTTYDLSFNANQIGTWLFHCHIVNHVNDSNGNYTGMITKFKVTQPQNQKFVDYQKNKYWSYNMLWAVNNSLIKGYQESNHQTAQKEILLKPYKSSTEGQALTLLYRYFDPNQLSTSTAQKSWGEIPYQLASLDKLPVKQKDINVPITRGHFAVLLASLYYGQTVDIQTAVQFMYNAGISNGFPDSNGQSPKTYTSFGVNKTVSRAQMVTFLSNLDHYKKTHPDLTTQS